MIVMRNIAAIGKYNMSNINNILSVKYIICLPPFDKIIMENK